MRDRHRPDTGKPTGVGWASASRTGADLAGLSILVVDDESLIALEMEQILRDAGAEVVGPALCLEEAMALVDGARPISMAVLDLRLGADSVAPVAGLLAERGTPMLFYTGQMQDEPLISAYGLSAYLPKPCAAGTLIARLRDLARLAPPTG